MLNQTFFHKKYSYNNRNVLSIVAFTALIFPLLASNALGQTYEALPDNSSINPEQITDEEMKYCIKLYNNAERLTEKIDRDRPQVDSYSEVSVSSFNTQVELLNSMNDDYNANCEGRDSSSSQRNTQELNSQGQ
jgi:hypothetical protein